MKRETSKIFVNSFRRAIINSLYININKIFMIITTFSKGRKVIDKSGTVLHFY